MQGGGQTVAAEAQHLRGGKGPALGTQFAGMFSCFGWKRTHKLVHQHNLTCARLSGVVQVAGTVVGSWLYAVAECLRNSCLLLGRKGLMPEPTPESSVGRAAGQLVGGAGGACLDAA